MKPISTKRRKRKGHAERVCLRCDRVFMSRGIYNRICPGCREKNTGVYDPGYAEVTV